MKISSYLLLLTLGFFLNSCQKEVSQPIIPSRSAVAVSVVQVAERQIPATFQFKGSFVPVQVLEVKAEGPGRVQGFSVVQGQSVSVGDALLRVEDEKLPLILQRQEAELREAEAQQEYEARVRESRGEVDVEQDAGVGAPAARPEVPETNEAPQVPEAPNVNPESTESGLPPVAMSEEMRVRAAQRVAQIRQRALERQRLRNAPATAQAPNQPEDEIVTESRRELNESKIERMRTEIEITEKQIASSALAAPIAGIVSLVKVADGSLVQAGEVLLEIVVIDPIDLSLKIPKNQIANIQRNLNILVDVPDLKLTNLKGELAFTDYEIKDQNFVEVRIRVSNLDLTIKKGMEGIAHLASSDGTRAALLVPAQSLVSDGSQTYVYLHRGENAERHPVQVGTTIEGMVEITQGLNKNDEVVLKGLDILKNETEAVPVVIQ